MVLKKDKFHEGGNNNDRKHENYWSFNYYYLADLHAKQEHEQVTAQIKLAPDYDPDSEISSLTLTIPSWVSSIERIKNTDLGNISDAGREILKRTVIIDCILRHLIGTWEIKQQHGCNSSAHKA